MHSTASPLPHETADDPRPNKCKSLCGVIMFGDEIPDVRLCGSKHRGGMSLCITDNPCEILVDGIYHQECRTCDFYQDSGVPKNCAGCGTNATVDVTDKKIPELPPVMIRNRNFAAAMYRWAMAGFPRRTQEEIDERLAICEGCEFFVNDHCSKCGCSCVAKNQVMNKLALATEVCPEGKWK